METENLSWSEFMKVDMRVGTTRSVEEFKNAKNPSYILHVDFGEYGIKKTSAQITKLYSINDLVGQQVIAVINFPPKQIANIMSECLVLGAVNDHEVTLLQPERKTKNGLRIG